MICQDLFSFPAVPHIKLRRGECGGLQCSQNAKILGTQSRSSGLSNGESMEAVMHSPCTEALKHGQVSAYCIGLCLTATSFSQQGPVERPRNYINPICSATKFSPPPLSQIIFLTHHRHLDGSGFHLHLWSLIWDG